MFKTIDPLATNWGNRLGILHRSFIDINTDLKTLSKSNGGIKNFGHLFNFATKQDIQNFQQFNRVIEDGQNAQRSYNTYLSTAPTSLRQLGAAIVDVKKEQYDLNTAYHQGKISQDEYNNKMQACNTRLQELRGSSNSLTLSQKALNTVMTIGSTVLNMAFNAAISIAISAIISAIQKAINAEKELIQKNKELSDSYKNNVQTLEDYREKYLDIIDSTDSEAEKDKQLIEWKKQLVKQYGLEEKALVNVNKERQTGIDLINQELYKEATKTISELKGYEKAYKQIYNASNVIANQRSYNSMWGLEQYGIGFDAVSNRDGTFNIKITYDTNDANKQLEQLEKLLSDLKAKSLQLDKNNPLYKQFHASVNNQIEFVQKEYDRVKGIVDNYNDTVTTGLAAYAQKYLYEFTNKTEGQISNVIDKASFDIWKDKLLEMAGDSDPLRQLLLELANNLFPQFTNKVEQSVEPTDDISVSITSLNDAFTKLKELLKDIVDYASTYQSAMAKISAGTALTTDEVMGLLEIDPSLYNKFVQKGDGTWSIDLGTLEYSYQAEIVDKGKDSIAKEKANWQKEYDEAKSEFNRLTKERSQLIVNDRWSSEQAYTLDQQIAATRKIMDEAQQNIGLADFRGNLLNYSDVKRIQDSVEAVKKEVDSYNDSISTLDKAIDSINEGNSLSYDEMTGLVNLYPQLQDKVVKTADGYTIEISALEDVRTKSYQTRNDYIDDQKAIVQAAIEGAKERIEAYRHEVNAINSQFAYEAALQSGLLAAYNSEISQLEGLENLLDVLDSLKNDVIDSDNSSSNSSKTGDLIQQQIDYYNNLIKAIEAVADKQIDRLNDEKEALREKNDEQQRELDLLEAKNNLEKAKKQKVFVYKEGEGLVQVQDEKAVADAQKEYNDIQNEIKEAEIDKQIDILTEYKDQFSDMESNIQDTLTVEQAKKALGTDEKGLLSLDDKTINGIRDGLAKAVYDKDVEDNKENSYYQQTSFAEFLKSLGATVTPQEFASIANNMTSSVPITSMSNGMINNAQSITNNKSVTLTPTFNIYGATDPQSVTNQIHGYMKQLLTETINSIK